MKRLRVIVADDSAICRAQLRHFLEFEKDIQVVGEAPDGSNVLNLVQQHRPDLVVVDLQMPGVDGLKAIEHIMARHPVPILVVTSRPGARSSDVVFEAIRRGALDLAEKPAGHDREAHARLRAMVRQLAVIPVVRHVGSRPNENTPNGSAVPLTSLPPLPGVHQRIPMIGVAASAGGPAALVALLKDVPAEFPGCIAVVQHLPPGFVVAFGQFLQRQTRLRVEVATDRTPIQRASIVLAPDECHLVVHDTTRFGLMNAPPVEGHLPAATVLLSSIARVFKSRGVGIVLSGIGRDGVAGLREMRERGAMTLAQSAETCAVYGMPRAAVETAAATVAAAPSELCRMVCDAVMGNPKVLHKDTP